MGRVTITPKIPSVDMMDNKKGRLSMVVNKIWAVYFSPTGSTRQITLTVAEQIGKSLQKEIREVQYTKWEQREKTFRFGRDELVIFGIPVYAGRVPNKILPDIEKGFQGDDTPLIPITVYGSRNFDDALIELKMVLEERGFHSVAAAAVASRHAFSDSLAAGRPDADDMQELYGFAMKAAGRMKKLESFPELVVTGNDPVGNYYVPLKEDGTPAKFLKAKPVTDTDRCTSCGLCAEICPMNSIDDKDYSVFGICIKCHACIRNCPAHAKSFTDEQFLSHVKMLEENYSRRAENCFFY